MVLITTSFKPKRKLFQPNPHYPFNIEGIYYTNQSLGNHDVGRVIFFYENGLKAGLWLESDINSHEFDIENYEQNYVKFYPKRFGFFCEVWSLFEQVNNKIIITSRILDGPFHHGIYSDTITILNDTTIFRLDKGEAVIYKMQHYPKPDSTIFKPCNKYFKLKIKYN
jgi:hypothetical protein